MTTPDRADLVVVGAGTIGGWASYFAKTDGAGRVVVLERGLVGMGASSRAAGIVRAQGGTPATVALGRWSIDFYRRQAATTRHGLGLPRARLPDPRGHRRRRAGRPRARRDAASRGPRRRLADGRRGRRGGADAVARRPSRRQLPRDRRLHRPAAQRPCLLAGDAGGGRRAPRANRVRGPPARADPGRRPPRRRRRDERRADRHGPRPAHGRPVAAGRRPDGRRPDPGRRGAPHGRRCSSRTRRSTSSGCRWCSTSARGCTGGSRRAASCSAGATRTRRPARRDRSTGRCTRRPGRGSAAFVPITRDLGLRKIWAATIDYTPDHLPILGPALTPDGAAIGGVTVASAGGHGMMWGPGVARVAVDLALTGRTDVARRDRPRARPVRRARPEPPRHRSRSRCRSRSTPRTPASAPDDPMADAASRSSWRPARRASRSAPRTVAASRRSGSTAGS